MKTKIFYYASFLLLAFVSHGCNDSDDYQYITPPSKPEPVEEVIDWQDAANKSSQAFLDNFWNEDRDFFNYYPYKPDTPAEDWHYWPQAHAMDVVIDAFNRTGDAKYSEYFSKWHTGVKQKSGGDYFNDFYDDMEWICLTMIRLYESTQEDKYMETAQLIWDEIKTGWRETYDGGILWNKTKTSKNACSNGPAGIIAARLYQINNKQEDLDWAKKIYSWQRNKLFNEDTGAIYDNIDGDNVIAEFSLTYNQGTHLGMAHELYKITGESEYLTDACKAADYCISKLIDEKNNILKSEGTGDGGLFKGIFIRYFVKLLLEEDLNATDKERFVNFFNHNAQVLWTKGVNRDELIYHHNWARIVLAPDDKKVTDMPCQVSGCTMIEAKAFYEKAILKQ